MDTENVNQPINNAAELRQRYAAGQRDFSQAELAGANLKEADLKNVNLQGANLKEADLRGANLSAADLKVANLDGAYLELTMLPKANLEGANLRGANLGGADLRGANLKMADLTFADFSDTSMLAQGNKGGANLEGANLRRANLRGTNLRGANLRGADLRGAELKGAYPAGAYYNGKTLFPADFDPVVSIDLQKSGTRKRTSSGQSLTRLFGIIAFGAVAVVLARRVMSPHTGAEAHNPKPTGTTTGEAEVEVDFKANKPSLTLRPNVQGKAQPAPAKTLPGITSTRGTMESFARFITHDLPGKITSVLGIDHPNQVASCPVLMRVINAANPDHPSAVDVSVNGLKLLSNVPFSEASRYVSVLPGNLRVQIMKAGTTKRVGSRIFAAAPNSAYTVAVTGPLKGSARKLIFDKSPFVIPEDLSPPKQGFFKGGLYILSETLDVINLRITKSGAPNIAQAQLVNLTPKTWVNYPELKAGTYDFNPVLPNQSGPLLNSAYDPPIRVEIAKAKIPAGTIFDVFAIGNALGKGHNSLKLSAVSYKALPPKAGGCKTIQ